MKRHVAVLKTIFMVLSVFSVMSLISCDNSSNANRFKPVDGSYMFAQPKKGDTIATIKTTKGDIKIRLFPDKTPKAVENFTSLANDNYYDGIIFHRVIPDFMIQTGDPEGTGSGGASKWGEAFEDEFAPELRNVRGAVSMANSGPGTNGSQFFIVQKQELTAEETSSFELALSKQDDVLRILDDGTEIKYSAFYPSEICQNYIDNGGTPWLDYVHTVFGYVIEGMDVVDAIANAPSDPETNKPTEEIKMDDVIIETVQ